MHNRLSRKQILFVFTLIITLLLPIVQNFATEAIPESWQPHLKWAWLVFALLGCIFIWINIQQHRMDDDDHKPAKITNLQNAHISSNEALASKTDTYTYDVYISYAKKDKRWVEAEMVPRLAQEKIKIAVSDEDGLIGVPFIINIEDGIKKSKRILIIISEAYLYDNMANFENILAQHLSIENGDYRLIPIIISSLDKTLIPPRLSMLTGLDLTDLSEKDIVFAKLLKAISEPLPKI